MIINLRTLIDPEACVLFVGSRVSDVVQVPCLVRDAYIELWYDRSIELLSVRF
jgi:hypothetical protein